MLTVPISTVLKFLPYWSGGAFPDYAFLDRMMITFVTIVVIMVIMSLAKPRPASDHHAVTVDRSMFKVETSFVVGSVIILGVLAALYTVFW